MKPAGTLEHSGKPKCIKLGDYEGSKNLIYFFILRITRTAQEKATFWTMTGGVIGFALFFAFVHICTGMYIYNCITQVCIYILQTAWRKLLVQFFKTCAWVVWSAKHAWHLPNSSYCNTFGNDDNEKSCNFFVPVY